MLYTYIYIHSNLFLLFIYSQIYPSSWYNQKNNVTIVIDILPTLAHISTYIHYIQLPSIQQNILHQEQGNKFTKKICVHLIFLKRYLKFLKWGVFWVPSIENSSYEFMKTLLFIWLHYTVNIFREFSAIH